MQRITTMDRKLFLKAIMLVPFVNVVTKGDLEEVTNSAIDSCKTGRDAEGPFYKPDAPMRSIIESEGDPLHIKGKVLKGEDCKTPVAKAIIDVWHCNKHGEYDMKGYNSRGQVITDARGYYNFATILPPAYGSRPRHIHFKIRAAGFKELTTQLYFEGDPKINNDFARNAEANRVIELSKKNGINNGTFIIYL